MIMLSERIGKTQLISQVSGIMLFAAIAHFLS